MPRYIDANMLLKKIYPLDLVDKRLYTINAKAVEDAIAKTPTADVAPKSEYEAISDELERTRSMVDNLRDDIRELKQAKAEVVREIFAELIEKIEVISVVAEPKDGFTMGVIKTFNKVSATITELKKKYIGEQK